MSETVSKQQMPPAQKSVIISHLKHVFFSCTGPMQDFQIFIIYNNSRVILQVVSYYSGIYGVMIHPCKLRQYGFLKTKEFFTFLLHVTTPLTFPPIYIFLVRLPFFFSLLPPPFVPSLFPFKVKCTRNRKTTSTVSPDT